MAQASMQVEEEYSQSQPLVASEHYQLDDDDGLFRERFDTESAPKILMWLVALCVPLGMVLANTLMVLCCEVLERFEIDLLKHMLSSGHLRHALLVKATFEGAVATTAAFLVTTFAKTSVGSGLPELKGYLNGNRMQDTFTSAGHIVRPLAMVLVMSSGLFVGREGPLIVMSGGIGILISQAFATGMFKSWLKRDTFSLTSGYQGVQRQKRFAEIERNGCILGCVAGMASSFNAPVGAVLYMIEETTTEGWPKTMTLKAFMASTISVLCTHFLFYKLGRRATAHSFLIDSSAHPFASHLHHFSWKQLPFLILLGVLGGLMSAAFAKCWILVWKLRKRLYDICEHRLPMVADAVIYTMACASVVMLVPCLVSCSTMPADQDVHIYAQYTCPAGEYNRLAALLLPHGVEHSVKYLYEQTSCKSEECFINLSFEEAKILPIAILVYFALSVGTAGLQIPAGSFVPNMFLGALTGRYFRQVLELSRINERFQLELAHPGIYAFLGSASMLAGGTRMSLAIAVLLMELSQNIALCFGLLVSICTSRVVSRSLVKRELCDELMELKGIPILPSSCPDAIAGDCVGDYCLRVPPASLLTPEKYMLPAQVQRALDESPDLQHFPVVDDRAAKYVVGLVKRCWLEQALTTSGSELLANTVRTGYVTKPSVLLDDVEADAVCSTKSGRICMDAFRNDVSCVVPEDVSVSTIYPLMTCASRRQHGVVCVIAKSGPSWVGVLDRMQLWRKSKEQKSERTPNLTPRIFEGPTLLANSQLAGGPKLLPKYSTESVPLSEVSTDYVYSNPSQNSETGVLISRL
eukprot:TRINITY_DN61046_c0_g1_i1.p1 TRINITY_DN61046_c0_g1~~TRINITY_DN61046_c0_g1_i1.p1  ORF type:complete len:808 (-),score=98.60 TRINITY_DN61046_c0_g1_i1:47-2470(-)